MSTRPSRQPESGRVLTSNEEDGPVLGTFSARGGSLPPIPQDLADRRRITSPEPSVGSWRSCPTTNCRPDLTGENCVSCPELPEVKADLWWESLTDEQRVRIYRRKR